LQLVEVLLEHGVENIVIDNNSTIGGQFNMQTHQFFFFEREKKFGGMRGFEIAKTLAGTNHEGIFLNSTVWDILENKRIAVKTSKLRKYTTLNRTTWLLQPVRFPLCPPLKMTICRGFTPQP